MNPLFPSTISTMIANVEEVSQQGINDASGNTQSYISNTQVLLNNAIIKSTSVTANRKLVAAFNTFVKTVAQAALFALSEIATNQIIITQYVPSIILTVAIHLANKSYTFLNVLINGTITTEISNISSYVSILESISISKDKNMYFMNAVQKNLINTASTMRRYGTTISIPSNDPYSVYDVVSQGVKSAAETSADNARLVGALNIAAATDASGYAAAREATLVAVAEAASAISPIEAKKLALNADKSANNARTVLNAINNLYTLYNNTTTKESIINKTALESLSLIASIISTIAKVTNNSSGNLAPVITRRAVNTILGTLKSIIENESSSLESAADALSVLELLNKASTIIPSNNDISVIQNKLWAINAATARAKEVSEKIKNKALLLNRTAHTSVTPEKIAIQTASSNTLATFNTNRISRMNRISRNVYELPPPAYDGFKATIRANTFIPIRPTLDELVFKNRIKPLRLDSLRTIHESKVKVATEVKEVLDKSGFSYRQ